MKHAALMTRTATVALLTAGLALAACNKGATTVATADQAPPPAAALPLTTASTQPIVDAPPASQLPPAPPARIAQVSNPGDDYAYIDQASDLDYGVGNAPPDYTFDYDGDRPWVWRSNDGWEEVVEPLSGGDRYYYYQSGSDYPFLIRDPQYTYGFDNGALTVVYDHGGHALPWSYAQRQAAIAGRYIYRAHAIYMASQQNQHEAVAAANWQARQQRIANDHAVWAQNEQQTPDWAAYHQQHWDQNQAHWDDERYRRQAEASRTEQMLGDAAAAAVLWQAAQQAHDHGRGGPGGGAPNQFFAQHNNPPAGSPAVQGANPAPGFAAAGDHTGGPAPMGGSPEEQRRLAEQQAHGGPQPGQPQGAFNGQHPGFADQHAGPEAQRTAQADQHQQMAEQHQQAAEQHQQMAEQHQQAAVQHQQMAEQHQHAPVQGEGQVHEAQFDQQRGGPNQQHGAELRQQGSLQAQQQQAQIEAAVHAREAQAHQAQTHQAQAQASAEHVQAAQAHAEAASQHATAAAAHAPAPAQSHPAEAHPQPHADDHHDHSQDHH